MEIKYIGHSSFFIKTKDAKVVTDPFDAKMVGMKFGKTDADIVTVSHAHRDHNATENIGGSPLILDWPGQFERLGVRIGGFATYHDKKKGEERGTDIMYKIEGDGVSVLHCGDLGLVPDDAFLEEIGDVDILLVPVGGHYTIDGEEALGLIKKVDPSVVIPMHYRPEKPTPDFEQLAPLSDFVSKIGAEQVVPMDKFVAKREEFGEELKVVLLNPTG